MTDAAIDFTAFRHPCLAVACPDCHARVGVWCKRPSGHGAMDLHKARRLAADRLWEKSGAPLISQVGPQTFVYDQPQSPPGETMKKQRKTKPARPRQAPASPAGPSMTSRQYDATLERLGMKQTGASGATATLGIADRTSRRYASGDVAIPEPVAKLLRLIAAGKISIDDVRGA